MLKATLFAVLSLVAVSSVGQVQTQIIGDSVRIHGNTGKGELILQNSTDSVKGFLFNKGAGRTVFQRGLIKINDSSYLIGADTLRLNNTGAGGGEVIANNIFYVCRKFSGVAKAVVEGNTLASVSSVNPTYTSQLANH